MPRRDEPALAWESASVAGEALPMWAERQRRRFALIARLGGWVWIGMAFAFAISVVSVALFVAVLEDSGVGFVVFMVLNAVALLAFAVPALWSLALTPTIARFTLHARARASVPQRALVGLGAMSVLGSVVCIAAVIPMFLVYGAPGDLDSLLVQWATVLTVLALLLSPYEVWALHTIARRSAVAAGNSDAAGAHLPGLTRVALISVVLVAVSLVLAAQVGLVRDNTNPHVLPACIAFMVLLWARHRTAQAAAALLDDPAEPDTNQAPSQ